MITPVSIPPAFKITAKGSILRGVTCENCGCQYLYKLTRKLETYHRGAINYQKDSQKAQTRLTRILQTAVNPVPCPDCGYLQKAMVRDVKQQRFGYLLLAAIASAVILSAMICLTSVPELGLCSTAVPIGLAILALAAFPIVAILILRHDPNTRPRLEYRLAHPDHRALRRADYPDLAPELFPPPPPGSPPPPL